MTNLERLTLINQFEILKSLNPEESSYYEEKIEILQEGYEFHYDEIFGSLSKELPEEDSRFVLDILNMYRDINFSKSKFTEEQFGEISELFTHYRGFDYNDDYEVSLGFYAKFFIKKLKRFQELIEDPEFEDYNSHSLMVSTYTRYLENYKELKTSEVEFGELTPEQIKGILR